MTWFLAATRNLHRFCLFSNESLRSFEPKEGLEVPLKITGDVNGFVVVKVFAPENGWGIEAIRAFDRLSRVMGVTGSAKPPIMRILQQLLWEVFDTGRTWSARAETDRTAERRHNNPEA